MTSISSAHPPQEDAIDYATTDVLKVDQKSTSGANRRLVINGIGYIIHQASYVTALSFEIAKANVKLGIGVGKSAVAIVGDMTGFATPSDLIVSAISVAEWITLTSIETGRFWADFGLGTAKFNLDILSVVFGSSDIAKSIVEFATLVQDKQILHDQETGLLTFPELLRGISSWVYLQGVTQESYKQLMWSSCLTRLVSKSDNINSEFVLEDFDRSICIEGDDEQLQALTDIKRFVSFANASYGDFGGSFLWNKIPHISTDAWYAFNAHISRYQPRNHHSFAHHTKSHVNNIYHSSETTAYSASYSPRFYVVFDHESNNVILSLRGTLSFHDILVDLTCENEEIFIGSEKCYVHQGMYRAAKKVGGDSTHPLFTAVRDALLVKPGWGLICTGHSLGGGVASLLTMLWGDPKTRKTSQSSLLPPDRPIRCYAYGGACVMSLNACKLMSRLIFSVTMEGDIVCRLSLGSCIDGAAAARYMYRNKDLSDTIAPQMFSSSASDADIQTLLEKRIQIEGQFMNSDKLYPAGTVLLLDKDVVYSVDRVDIVYGQLYLGSSIERHLPNSYESWLNDIKLP